jgi:hypothetical protein
MAVDLLATRSSRLLFVLALAAAMVAPRSASAQWPAANPPICVSGCDTDNRQSSSPDNSARDEARAERAAERERQAEEQRRIDEREEKERQRQAALDEKEREQREREREAQRELDRMLRDQVDRLQAGLQQTAARRVSSQPPVYAPIARTPPVDRSLSMPAGRWADLDRRPPPPLSAAPAFSYQDARVSFPNAPAVIALTIEALRTARTSAEHRLVEEARKELMGKVWEQADKLPFVARGRGLFDKGKVLFEGLSGANERTMALAFSGAQDGVLMLGSDGAVDAERVDAYWGKVEGTAQRTGETTQELIKKSVGWGVAGGFVPGGKL